MLIAILAFYGSHFRQASNLRVDLRRLDPTLIPSPSTRRDLGELFTRACLDRGPFRTCDICFPSIRKEIMPRIQANVRIDESVQKSGDELEKLVKVLVVDHEVKRLGNKRSKGRHQTQVMVVNSSPDMSFTVDLDEDIDMD